MDEPPVKLAIRKGRDDVEWRYEHEWPLARTQWTKYYLIFRHRRRGQHGQSGDGESERNFAHLRRDQPWFHGLYVSCVRAGHGRRHQTGHGNIAADAAVDERRRGDGSTCGTFWVSSSTEDMDLFLTLRNFDAEGNEVLETGQQGTPVPVAKGWLRVSHRELDPELTLPYRPYHNTAGGCILKPGEIVKVDVEIWPTSMVFKKGHRIRLDVQPRDGVGSQSYMHYHADYNTGTNTIYAGGERESYLLCRLYRPSKTYVRHWHLADMPDSACWCCRIGRNNSGVAIGVLEFKHGRLIRQTLIVGGQSQDKRPRFLTSEQCRHRPTFLRPVAIDLAPRYA